MAITADGKEAITHWRVIKRFGVYTLLHLQLETGRTHQIRVHMASLHHPVTGDTVYGAKKAMLGLSGQALHGFRMHFFHPVLQKEMQFLAPLPEYFSKALERIGFDPSEIRLEDL